MAHQSVWKPITLGVLSAAGLYYIISTLLGLLPLPFMKGIVLLTYVVLTFVLWKKANMDKTMGLAFVIAAVVLFLLGVR